MSYSQRQRPVKVNAILLKPHFACRDLSLGLLFGQLLRAVLLEVSLQWHLGVVPLVIFAQVRSRNLTRACCARAFRQRSPTPAYRI